MQVGLLGPLRVAENGRSVRVGGARLRALLIRLALDAGQVVSIESLAGAVWPEGEPADPKHAVQSLVTRLRRVLPQPSALRSAPGGYRLDLPPTAVDALRFERLVRQGRRALRDGQPAHAARLLREALQLWRGEALAEVASAPFASAAVARLTELRLAATEDRIAADLSGGADAAADPARLVVELEELTTAYPVRERLHALLVRALVADGRPGEALTAYQRIRERLADELGADPGPELRQAHLAALRAADLPPRRRGNLPTALTSFVGRDRERVRLGEQLAQHRLVTLVGPGGVGKTRLATTVAAGLADRYPGGAWLVELGAVTEPAEVAPAVAAALGLREPSLLDQPAAARDPVGRLVEALAGDPALLVMDNCEHLVDAAAGLVEDLLGRCPRLRVLATSREPLRIPGEALHPVPSLAVAAAVRLFADRAAAVRPDLPVAGPEHSTVVEICQRLDGLPLAIELAAAHLRTLPLERLASGLDDRFRLLTRGSRTALPRQRTLRAVVAWSWGLLDPADRRAAERLAVFPATITQEAAGAVGVTADQLAVLVDKSLLQLLPEPRPRYRMLETIRAYGRERLAEAGELGSTRAAHAGYVRQLAHAAEPHLRGAGQLPWVRRLGEERENLLAALQFARDTGDGELAVGLAAALGQFWTLSGNHAEAAGWLRLALAVPGGDPAARTTATAYYLFNLALSEGRALTGTDEVRQAAAGADPAVPAPGAALIEPLLALIADDTRAGLAASARRHPDPWTAAMRSLVRSFLRGNDGDMDGMRRDLAAAADRFRSAGERWGLATALTFLAHTQITLGRFGDAVGGLTEAIGELRELDPEDPAVLPRVLLAVARAQQGDTAAARADLRALVATGHSGASTGYLVLPYLTLGDLARLEGDLAEAARQYRAAEQWLSRLPVDAPLLRAMLRCGTGRLAVARGDLAAAREQLAEALATALELPDIPLVAEIGVAVAGWLGRGGDAAAAAEVLGAAHALRGAPDAFDPDVLRLRRELAADLGAPTYQQWYERARRLDRAAAVGRIEAQVRRR